MKSIIILIILVTCFNVDTTFAACDETIVASTPSSRFVIHGAEVYDQKTTLTWKRCSAGTSWKRGSGCVGAVKLMRLDEATQFAQAVGAGWRIPTLDELYDILEQKCINPAINANVFPNVQDYGEGAPYWSVTSVEGIPSLIYYVDFLSGAVDGHTKGFPMAVRLVRDKQ